jgi:hypothetical protein
MSLISWKNKSTGTDQQKWERVQREIAEAKRQYEELMQQQALVGSGRLDPNSMRAVDEVAENAVAKAQASAREAQIKLQDLQHAVASIVLRLKVLDVEALEKDLGEDGTVPLRLALSELKQLLAAYDGLPKTSMPDYGGLTYATTTAPTAWYQQQMRQASSTYYNTSGRLK